MPTTTIAAPQHHTDDAMFQALHDALPLDDADRHDMNPPALDAAFTALAADHPDRVTPSDGGDTARDIDRQQLLLAAADIRAADTAGLAPRLLAAANRLQGGHEGGAA
ncbi:hypothetical protein ACIQU5_28085 [Streptomyces sp. NPDC090306]|uniref:hypothetical protein n=1 Tax=Streptomyces sp. NPDC090306 TaxID=3365961 RepID=UPI00380CA805